jgi:hypothetical protein
MSKLLVRIEIDLEAAHLDGVCSVANHATLRNRQQQPTPEHIRDLLAHVARRSTKLWITRKGRTHHCRLNSHISFGFSSSVAGEGLPTLLVPQGTHPSNRMVF